MSSHHFVREGQEPALLIMDEVPFNSLGGLLEWAPTILVSHAMLDVVLAWGIRVDVVVAERRDEEYIRERMRERQVIDVVLGSQDPVSLAVDYLSRRRQNELTIVTKAQTDIFSIASALSDTFKLVIMDGEHRWIPVQNEFRKWTAKDSRFRIAPADGATFSTTGLRGENGVFMANADGIVTVSSRGLTWLGEVL